MRPVLAGIATTITLLSVQPGFAQPTPDPQFEVASVKLDPFDGKGRVGIMIRGNTFDAAHVSLFWLVTFAWNLRDVQLSGGPPWVRNGVLVDSRLFQVIAKAPGETPPSMDAFRQMLQALLADRFKLQIHHVQKELPIYNMVVNKSGPKLKESAADAKLHFETSSVGPITLRIVATHMTVQDLIDQQLRGYTDRPIFDKTGLTAPWDFTLEFVRENLPPEQESGPRDGPALVTAVQEQLGLKLEPAKAPFDTVVIDHVELPSEN